MRELRRGDLVRVRRDEGDEWCRALVSVASRTSVLLSLANDAAVRQGEGFVMGALALTLDYEQGAAQGLTGDFYDLEVAETRAADRDGWADAERALGERRQQDADKKKGTSGS